MKLFSDSSVFLVMLLVIVALALFIDIKRKRNNNNPLTPTNPNAKPGDSSNYIMGDNKHIGGGV
jgi:hypothetical protein